MRLSGELLKRALANPLGADEEVRQECGVPDNRYYEMSVWPVAGIVTVSNRLRERTVKKISKSDQK